MIFVIIVILWMLSVALSATIMVMREIEPNPLSMFIVCCPIVNTVYVLVRIKHLKPLFSCIEEEWLKDMWNKL